MSYFWPSKLKLLEKGLDSSWQRNKVIANNIANAETPNYKASKVEFENILKSELDSSSIKMKASSSKHISVSGTNLNDIKPMITKDYGASMNLDGNTVDVENEMSELAKNNLLYQLLIKKTSKEFSRIKYAITGGK